MDEVEESLCNDLAGFNGDDFRGIEDGGDSGEAIVGDGVECCCESDLLAASDVDEEGGAIVVVVEDIDLGQPI